MLNRYTKKMMIKLAGFGEGVTLFPPSQLCKDAQSFGESEFVVR